MQIKMISNLIPNFTPSLKDKVINQNMFHLEPDSHEAS